MTEKGIVQAMELISESYPNAKMGVNTAAVWFDMLHDIEDMPGLAAVRAHISEEQWPPTIAHIRKAVCHVDLPSVGDAWAEVERKIRGEEVKFSSQMIADAYREAGSPNGQRMTDRDLPFERKRFEGIYAELCTRRQRAENIQRLNAPREAARLGE